jgi:hypothetical protein
VNWAPWVVIPVLVALAVSGAWNEHRRSHRVIGRRVPFGELLGDPETDRYRKPRYVRVTHLLPAEGSGEYLTQCCGRSPLDLAAGHHGLTVRPEQATCSGGDGLVA